MMTSAAPFAARWRPSRLQSVLALVVFLGLSFAVSGISSAVTIPEVRGWYQTLVRPSWTPPDWVFGPVWTTLYILMSIAAWRVWRRAGRGGYGALSVYLVQLALNFAWSMLFFGLHALLIASIEILVLWAAIAATWIAFNRHDRLAALLLVPYLAWVGYAATLSWGVWSLN